MCLGVLRVRPAESEVPGLDKVRAAFLTGLVIGKSQRQLAVELVVYLISGVDVHGP